MLKNYIVRVFWVIAGAAVSALGVTMMLCANIGLEPWSVLHQGMAQTINITYGVASIVVGAVVLTIAVILGESFGLGTVSNILLCGILIDALQALGWVPRMETVWGGVLMLIAGLEVLAIGTWMYLKSALGAGPRDALMVALARKTGRSVGLCRAVVDLTVVLSGWLLGGPVGLGTIIAAFGQGTLFNVTFALLHFNAAGLHQENLAETVRNFRPSGASK